MLTEIYIETLLVDEELADQVCEAWDASSVKIGRIVQLRSRIPICHRAGTAGHFFVMGITALFVTGVLNRVDLVY